MEKSLKNFKKIAAKLLFVAFLICSVPSFANENEIFEDEIIFTGESLKLNFEKNLPETFCQKIKKEAAGLEYNKQGVTIFSRSKKELNDYMVNDYKSTTGATLNPNGRLSLTGGMEIKHQNPNASINSKKIFLTQDLRLNKNISFAFANKFNNENKTHEHEFKVKYKPKILQNADFNISTGGVWEEDNMQSKKLEFQSNLFLF